MVIETTSRQWAKAFKLKTYFTGKPCERGHIAERKVTTGHCLMCTWEDSRARQKAARKVYDKQYREKLKARRK